MSFNRYESGIEYWDPDRVKTWEELEGRPRATGPEPRGDQDFSYPREVAEQPGDVGVYYISEDPDDTTPAGEMTRQDFEKWLVANPAFEELPFDIMRGPNQYDFWWVKDKQRRGPC